MRIFKSHFPILLRYNVLTVQIKRPIKLLISKPGTRRAVKRVNDTPKPKTFTGSLVNSRAILVSVIKNNCL